MTSRLDTCLGNSASGLPPQNELRGRAGATTLGSPVQAQRGGNRGAARARSSPVASRKQSRATPAMRRRQSRFDGGPFRAAAAETAHANKAAVPAAPALLAAASSGPATLASASRSPQQLKASTQTAQAAPLTALPAVSVSSATDAINAAVMAPRSLKASDACRATVSAQVATCFAKAAACDAASTQAAAAVHAALARSAAFRACIPSRPAEASLSEWRGASTA